MNLKDKTILVIGLARTGRETARFLARRGAKVVVTDRRTEAELQSELASLAALPIEYRVGGENPAWAADVDCIVPSPGVPMDNPILKEALRLRVPILSEIELASRFIRAPWIAITGTNGKSTTTTLVGEMLKARGDRVFVGGNLGSPMIGFAADAWDWGVIEVSSFQLEWVEGFRPRVAVLLNLSEDHLDRYPSFAAYAATKERIFAAQQASDVAILNREDPLVWAMRERMRAEVVSFGFSDVSKGCVARPGAIVWREGDTEEVFPLDRVRIHGLHNLENMMAAIAAAKSAGVSAPTIQRALEAFPGLEHRLEFVREKQGVRFFNDSKATNVGAAVKSLASFSAPVILLAGGVDKGGDYAPLRPEIRSRVRRLVLFGAAKEKIASALADLTETVVVGSLEEAVRDAAAHAQPGDVVLLAPACSSFDMFRDYADRGNAFKTLVHNL